MNRVRSRERMPTTIGTWIQAIVRTLDARGVDGSDVALTAGISARVLCSVDERAPQDAVTRLWRAAVEATGDPCFGLHVSGFVGPVTFHALGYAVLASPNLKAALQRVIRFQRLISDAVEQKLVLRGDRYRYVIERVVPHGPPDEAIDAFMTMSVRTVRTLTRPARTNPLGLWLQRPEPASADLFHEIFRCPITFGADEDAFEYARADVEAPLPFANLELARQSDEIIADYMARTGRSEALPDLVAALIVKHLPSGRPSEAIVARHLRMSPRNLQLQLAQHGISYKTLLNHARYDLARRYLEQGRYSIKEIAFLLGFSDAATFSRAFRRWAGQSPRRFALPSSARGPVAG